MIASETLIQVMLDNRELVASKKVFPRETEIGTFPRYVLVGVRRSGKSYLLYQKIQSLLVNGKSWDDMLYLNFEDERLLGFDVSDFNSILSCHTQISGKKDYPILFLDEIQIIDGWERFARRMADTGLEIYITGSNAKMLSTDVAAVLGGRFMSINVFPLSFGEFLGFKNIPSDLASRLSTAGTALIKNGFSQYLRFGGFPECAEFQNPREYLNSILQKVYIGDIAVRNKVENLYALRVLLKKIAESVGQPVSYTRLTRIVTAVGVSLAKNSCISYLNFAQQACLILRLDNIVGKLSDRESNPKFYFVDTGLIELLKQDNLSDQLENLVAIELLHRYGREEAVFFYKRDIEVDFYIPEEKIGIQVCVRLGTDPDTIAREIGAFDKMEKEVELKRRIIITSDEEKTLRCDMGDITVIPAWKWLLDVERKA